jgi:hypothetical protein
MPFTRQHPTLLMQWCLDCHRDPAQALRPREHVFDVDYRPPANQADVGLALAKQYNIRSPRELTDCTICHR